MSPIQPASRLLTDRPDRACPRRWGRMAGACAALLALLAAGPAIAAKTHAGPPEGVTLPDTADGSFAFFEGEVHDDDRGDTLDPEAHRDATFFCDRRSPDDQYWSEGAGYDDARAATRGAAVSLKNHRFEWRGVGEHLTPGIYDVYVRGRVHPGGAAIYSLATSAGEVAALQDIRSDTPNISWFRLGSVMIDGATEALTLTVETEKSPVTVDTVLLVSPEHVERAAALHRVPGEEAWASDQSLIFTADRGEITYEVAGAGADGVDRVVYSLRDEAGRVLVHEASAEPSAAEPNRWSIELPTRGYYDVTVRAYAGDDEPLETNLSAAVIGESIDEAVRMASRFGVWNVHGDTRLAVLAGSRWNRRMTAFFGVERDDVTDGPWTRADNGTHKDGMDRIGVFAFGLPTWLMDLPEGTKPPSYGNPFYPATDWQLLSNLVSHYATVQPLPDVVEMYNEPLAHWHGTDEQLIAYAAAVRQGLLAVDPAFKLVGPCLYSIRIGDLTRLADKGLFEHLDGVAMHAYVNGTRPEDEFADKLAALNAFVAQTERPDMPVYLTEFGWTRASGTWQEPVDTLTQAQYCARSLILGMAQDIDALIYFCLQYKTTNEGEAGFSLVDPQDRLSPAYVSFATIVKFFAAAEPIGHWEVTPTSHLVLAQRDGQVLAAVWDTQGRRTVELPWPITDAMGMTGTPVEVGEGNRVEISPSPLYLTLDAPGLMDIQTADAIEMTLSSRDGAAAVEGMLTALDQGAAPGRYTAFNRTPDGWVAQPVTLHQPISLVETKLAWPMGDDRPHLAGVLRSNLKTDAVTVTARVQPGGVTQTIKVPPRSIRVVRFPMDSLTPAARTPYAMTIEGSARGEALTLSDRGEVTLVSALGVEETRSPWPDDLAAADFTGWAPFPDGESAAGPDRTDCAATFRAVYGDSGLRIEVVVTDDEHQRPAPGDTPQNGWTRDSIQLGFDMDIDRPWTAGVVGTGLGGHRVFEFTVVQDAGSPDGAAVFRHRSYTESLPPNQIADGVVASVTREADQTRYDVFFPWEALAVAAPMTRGGAIGIAVAVNDVDPRAGRRRHGLRLFEGIVQTKDPKLFGKLWLR